MILIDAHGHIYDCYEMGRLFNSALRNFKSQPEFKTAEKEHSRIIFLADWHWQNWFYRISKMETGNKARSGEIVNGWLINPTKESQAVWVQRSEGGEGFYLFAGRKVISSENLEVLALFEENPILPGRSLQEIVTEVREKGGIPVIPWAFGKWTGKRRATLAALIDSASGNDFFLADNGNRPAVWPRPTLFGYAEKKGIRILAGSDPLEFPAEQDRIGSYGFSLSGELDEEFPVAHLKSLIESSGAEIQLYGRRTGISLFLQNQVRLRLRKRRSSFR